MLAVEITGERKRFGSVSRSRSTRQEARHVSGVLFKLRKALAQVRFFATHYWHVNNQKHQQRGCRESDAARRDAKSHSHDERAEIKRTARVSVRTAGGEFF